MEGDQRTAVDDIQAIQRRRLGESHSEHRVRIYAAYQSGSIDSISFGRILAEFYGDEQQDWNDEEAAYPHPERQAEIEKLVIYIYSVFNVFFLNIFFFEFEFA